VVTVSPHDVPTPPADDGVVIAELPLAKLAGRAARTTYGVVGMHSSAVRRMAGLFRSSLTEGVEVDVRDGVVFVTLHVVMERGVNLAEVTATLQEQVRYEIEQSSGLPVGDVEVRVEDLRE
jgi:uncharacterized alkaline shock family protein YloU